MGQSDLKMNLKGKLALVTGASKGIGRAIALCLAENGADVLVNYCRSEKEAIEVVSQIRDFGIKSFALQADVGLKQDVERMFREAREKIGRTIDILVNNAGTQVALSTIELMDLELWNRVLAINLNGALLCCQQAISGMKEKRWGRIINITSISGRTGGGPGGVHYASSKGALAAFTKGLAKELGPSGITVNAVAPGVILTEMHEKFSTKKNLEFLRTQIPLGRLGLPEEVAGAVIFLASDAAAYITGETISVNGGLRMD